MIEHVGDDDVWLPHNVRWDTNGGLTREEVRVPGKGRLAPLLEFESVPRWGREGFGRT